MKGAGLTPDVHLVEASPVLREAQAKRVPEAAWHDDLATLPTDGPLLVVANEFFDALPIRQLDAAGRDLAVVLKEGRLIDRKSTRLNSSHLARSRMPSSA